MEYSKFLKSIGIGALIGFISYLAAGDGGVSVGLFFLITYLELKLEKKNV